MARVLIIDNIDYILNNVGHKITIAYSGLHALLLHSKNKYDLIITDIGTPNENGVTFLVDLIKKRDKTPVIVISDNHRDLIYAAYLGFETIKKPFTGDQLLSAVKKIDALQLPLKNLAP